MNTSCPFVAGTSDFAYSAISDNTIGWIDVWKAGKVAGFAEPNNTVRTPGVPTPLNKDVVGARR
jgi:hypothetical protein